jgi:hypothetical protein
MKTITIPLPEIKDTDDKVEVRKALLDLVKQLNELMKEIEARLTAGGL